MLNYFERLVDPYPGAPPEPLPDRLLPFVWAATRGMRGHIAVMTVLTALIGAFEALLFAMMGNLVDWMGATPRERFWAEHGTALTALGMLLVISIAVVSLQSLFKQQALAGNFPMRMRWNFHRLMLGQSMSFYQDEFAGRIATKLMQTALSVRDVVMIVCDIGVYVGIYFLTVAGMLLAFDPWMLLPFGLWMVVYAFALRWFVPRMGKVAEKQADARSLMTGRITDEK